MTLTECFRIGKMCIRDSITGIVGLVLGVMAKKKQPCGMATAGIVLSAVALGLCVITFIACFACTACALGSAGSLSYLA